MEILIFIVPSGKHLAGKRQRKHWGGCGEQILENLTFGRGIPIFVLSIAFTNCDEGNVEFACISITIYTARVSRRATILANAPSPEA